MRNRILLLLTLLLLGTAPAGWAQRDSLAVSSPGQHWEIQAVGGMHGMWKIPRKGKITVAPMVTPAFDITLSKWFSPQIGAGMGWQGSQMEHAGADRFSFAYIHADLLWNATNSFGAYDPSRRFDIIPYGHFGYLQEWRGERVIEREYASGIGVMGRYALNDHFRLTLDTRSTLLNGASSQGLGIALLQTAQVGVTYLMGTPHWNRVGAGDYLSGDLLDHWFFSVGGGVNSISQLSLTRPRFTGDAASALDLAVGKWVHPAIGVRVGLQGLAYAGHGNSPRPGVTATPMEKGMWAYREQFSFLYPHIDLLWNFVHTFRGYAPERKVVFAPYAHFGAIWEHNNNGRTIEREYAAGAGLLVQGPVYGPVGWHVDLRGTAFTAAATGDARAPHSVGITVLGGLQYHLGRQTWDRKPGGAPAYAAVLPWFDAGQGWFFQTSLGVRDLFDIGQRFVIRNVQEPSADGEIAVGKWLTPVSGIRVGLSGLSAYMIGDRAGQLGLHLDYLMNVLQWIWPSERRFWNPVPYAFGGYLASYGFGNPTREWGAAGWVFGGGLLSSFRLTDHLDLTLDFRGTLLSPKAVINPKFGYIVQAEGLLGLQYRPGDKPWYGPARPEPRNGRHLWALSTNLADWADFATMNAELLYGVSRHFTLDAQVQYGFLDTSVYDQRERYAIGARWWPWYTYSGWWVRSMLQAEIYNRQGMPVWQDGAGQAWGMSLGAGYALMLTKWLNLDLGAGVWGGRRGLPGEEQNWFWEPEMLTLGLMFVF